MSKLTKALITLALMFPVASFAMPPHPRVLEQWKEKGILQQKTAALTAMKLKGMDAPSKSFPTSGNGRVLILLVQFSDESMSSVSTTNFYDNLFSNESALSWKKYYLDMSNNTLNLTFDVYGPYTASGTHDNYGVNSSDAAALVREAVVLADADGVDFSLYDNDDDNNVDGVIVIHQGPGEEFTADGNDIWSHNWTLSSGATTYSTDGVTIDEYAIQPEYVATVGDSTIGVFCHEFGHVLGLPDLYDTGAGGTAYTYGVGKWSLMAGGSWNGPSGKGSVPAPLLAWERNMLGWATITDAVTGTNSVTDIETSRSALRVYLNYVSASDNQYLLLENIVKGSTGAKIPPVGKQSPVLPWLLFTVALSLGTIPFALKRKPKRLATAVLSLVIIPVFLTLYPACGGSSDDGGGGAVTWNSYLPGDGLLITHVDSGWINATNVMNYNIVNWYCMGVKIEEADGGNDLYYMYNRGEATDTFYAGNSSSITPYTNPDTDYNDWDWDGSTLTRYSSQYSGVSITDISAKGTTMTFELN